METAGDLVKDALQELLVQAVESPIEPDEMQTGIRYLNRMMAEFKANGVDIGYTPVTNQSDDVDVDAGAYAPITVNLAVRLASQYDKAVPAPLASLAQSGVNTLIKLSTDYTTDWQANYPDTLPVGSGNRGGALYVDPFFQQPETDTVT